AAPGAPARACDSNPDYVRRPGASSRYRAVSGLTTWRSAEAACARDEAHLVVIDDAAENAYVGGLLTGRFWIGLTDSREEGTFEWVTGAPLVYQNWGASEPNDGGFGFGEDCVEMRVDERWNDEGCAALLGFVCECAPSD